VVESWLVTESLKKAVNAFRKTRLRMGCMAGRCRVYFAGVDGLLKEIKFVLETLEILLLSVPLVV
jgi:hypothetical protein